MGYQGGEGEAVAFSAWDEDGGGPVPDWVTCQERPSGVWIVVLCAMMGSCEGFGSRVIDGL